MIRPHLTAAASRMRSRVFAATDHIGDIVVTSQMVKFSLSRPRLTWSVRAESHCDCDYSQHSIESYEDIYAPLHHAREQAVAWLRAHDCAQAAVDAEADAAGHAKYDAECAAEDRDYAFTDRMHSAARLSRIPTVRHV